MLKAIYYVFGAILIGLGYLGLGAQGAQARDSANELFWGGTRDRIRIETGLGAAHPIQVAADIIAILLGFLGIIAVVIIMLAGFRWMVSGGNEDRAAEAKKMLAQALIGIIIILGSFALASFILSALGNATGAG
jgi:hypothetical protein